MDAIANELHRPARRRYPRRRVTLKGLHDLIQADLVEMIPHAKINKGFKYILTMINCFSKFAFAVPLKTKTGLEVAKALEPILKKQKFKNLQTDAGKEFFNTQVKRLTTKYKINHYSTFSDLKASIVERLNRTLKERMYALFTAQGSYRWLALLPRIVKEYNNTVHSTIKMKPKDVTRKHEKELLARLNKDVKQAVKQVFEVGTKVRISKNKRTFSKGYLPNWTNEVFTIFAVKNTKPVTYILQDAKGNILKGGFYKQELLQSKTGNVYLIDKIIKRSGNKVFVKYKGYDHTFNEWIHKKNIITR